MDLYVHNTPSNPVVVLDNVATFRELYSCLLVARSGDVIHLDPGSHIVRKTCILKDGITIQCDRGLASVTYQSDTAGPLLTDNGVAAGVVFMNVNFYRLLVAGAPGTAYALNLSHATSVAFCTNTFFSSNAGFAVYNNGTLEGARAQASGYDAIRNENTIRRCVGVSDTSFGINSRTIQANARESMCDSCEGRSTTGDGINAENTTHAGDVLGSIVVDSNGFSDSANGLICGYGGDFLRCTGVSRTGIGIRSLLTYCHVVNCTGRSYSNFGIRAEAGWWQGCHAYSFSYFAFGNYGAECQNCSALVMTSNNPAWYVNSGTMLLNCTGIVSNDATGPVVLVSNIAPGTGFPARLIGGCYSNQGTGPCISLHDPGDAANATRIIGVTTYNANAAANWLTAGNANSHCQYLGNQNFHSAGVNANVLQDSVVVPDAQGNIQI